MQFAHLHLHTQYSLLDGLNRVSDVAKQAKALGQTAVAITDHGNLHGAIEFYSAAKEAEIKPIIGCELYVTPGSRFERKMKTQGGAGTHHLTVLAQDMAGYRNLCRLVTLAYKEGFYFKPRVDHDLLTQYSQGLIALSGCLAGELNSFVEIDNIEAARKLIEFYSKTFPSRFFLEVQPHGIAEQQKLNLACAELCKEIGVPIVATTDCHYSTADHHFAQEVMMCISTGKQITDPDRLRHEGVKLHLKDAQEMFTEFNGWRLAEEAINNSVEIAKSCNLEFDFTKHHMPRFEPEKGKTLEEMMAEKSRAGLEKRLDTLKQIANGWSDAQTKQYQDRLESEIEMIGQMGFVGYLLVVADFIVWAKEQGIPVGPGRGSVAGSLVAWALRITEVDPIANKLIFERFLNPDRVSLPDIDVDFCIYGRDRVIKYVVDKYGADRVAQIATFGTLKAKAVIKDVGRALGRSYAEMDRIAQLVPAPRQGFDFSLTEALKMEERLAEYARSEGKEVIELALKLEGLTRHASTHAAGVVIGDRPLTEFLPLMVDKDGNDVTQYSMKYVEKIGLVKFDFLGLKTLTVIHRALRMIEQGRGLQINLETLPLDDPKTYAPLCAGNTIGVFQLESSGITEMTMRLKPNCFDDLVAILALYRPGPLDSGMADHYIERKHGREPVSYEHPAMKKALEDTYGIILYQEQIMELARELAGYSLGEADILRRAMGKKNSEEMAKQRDRFISGAIKRGIAERIANKIFDQMETFARYGFNRSHSAAYAMVSFQTAYLKAHYNVEFMAALMTNEMDDSDRTLKNLNECRKQKIDVLPPDVNISGHDFTVDRGKIRFGLSAMKGVGSKAVENIIEVREANGPFENLEDLLMRVDLRLVNKRVLESLVNSGAFDFAKVPRRQMYESIDDLIKAAQSRQKNQNTTQISLFGEMPQPRSLSRKVVLLPEWPVNKRLAFEREALGFYISGHPLTKFQRSLRKLGAVTVSDLRAAKQRPDEVRVAGVITALKLKNTKKGDRYATFTLEDYSGTIESIVWPDTYRQVANLMVADDPVIITARTDITEERCNLIVNKMESLIDLRDRNATQGLLTFRTEDKFDERLEDLLGLLGKYTGNCPVKVKLDLGQEEVWVVLKDKREAPVAVMPSEDLCDQVEQLFGRPVLSFV